MEQDTGSEQTAPTIEARLADPAEPVRLAALAELMKPDGEPAQVLEGVAACLDHSSAKVRTLAVVVLGKVAAQRQGAVPAVSALARALEQTQPMPVRVFAAVGLAQAGPDAASAIESLCRAMDGPDKTLRASASLALGKIGAPAVPWLRRLLRLPEPATVCAAVDALALVGRPAKDAIKDLRSLRAGPDAKIQQACDSALDKIGGGEPAEA